MRYDFIIVLRDHSLFIADKTRYKSSLEQLFPFALLKCLMNKTLEFDIIKVLANFVNLYSCCCIKLTQYETVILVRTNFTLDLSRDVLSLSRWSSHY